MREEDAARAAELAAYFTHCQLQVCVCGGGGWRVGGRMCALAVATPIAESLTPFTHPNPHTHTHTHTHTRAHIVVTPPPRSPCTLR